MQLSFALNHSNPKGRIQMKSKLNENLNAKVFTLDDHHRVPINGDPRNLFPVLSLVVRYGSPAA